MSVLPPFTTRPTLTGTFGMVASTHWIASGAAQGLLERGGNAFDAAAGGGFVLHLVEPHLNGPGGDLVGVFTAASAPGDPVVLMGQGAAPARATIAHMRDEGLDMVPGAGGLAAAVPAAVDAWLLLVRDHGTMELSDILAPAIAYARDGVPLLPTAAATIERVRRLFTDHWPSSAALWLPDGRAPRPGALWRNEEYAAILTSLAQAPGATRRERIDAARRRWRDHLHAAVAFLARPHRHSSGTDHAAVLAHDDLARDPACFEDAVTAEFRGHTIAKAGPWSQGPSLLVALRMLDALTDDRIDPSTAIGVHTIVETLKIALADRDAYFGDDVDPAQLLSDAAIGARLALIGETASRAWRPGPLEDSAPFHPPLRPPRPQTAAGTGEPTVERTGAARGDTCHIDVVDRWGNMIAVTPSGGWLQSSPAIPGLGFCLGTRLQMMWLDPASPSALRAGRRPRTTLSPTLVMRDGAAVTALGTPGGDQQEQWQLPFLVRLLVRGDSGQEAIDAPTFHTTALVDSFWPRTFETGGVVVEDRLGEELIDELTRRGHTVTRAGDWHLGRLSAVGIDRAHGSLWAAANPRGMQGYAVGR